MMDNMETICVKVEGNPDKMTLKVKIRNKDGEQLDGIGRLFALHLLGEIKNSVNDAITEQAKIITGGVFPCAVKRME